jgi:integral membrane protein
MFCAKRVTARSSPSASRHLGISASRRVGVSGCSGIGVSGSEPQDAPESNEARRILQQDLRKDFAMRASGEAARDERSSLRASLLRYRVLAYTTAVLLIVLVFVGVPLQLAANRPQVVNVVGTLHGILYIVYLFTAFDLTRRMRLRITQMAMVLLAGTVPFCAIIAERLLTRMVGRTQAAEDTASSPPSQ